MPDKDQLELAEWHAKQIEAYAAVFPEYENFADALRRVLEEAKRISLPKAIVQARPKAVPNFAEKCIRKRDKYPDPVNNFTDLCGGRVIVQTLDQLAAVRLFVRKNFRVIEEDEKGEMLGDDKFGYRDLHFLVKLNPERASAIGFSAEEIEIIADKTAELQIRTIVQHAWADTLHDRMYKTELTYPSEFERKGALLAAIMEDGDRQFNQLAGDIDSMQSSFNAYASGDEVERETNVLKLILANSDERTAPIVALKLSRLLAARGDFERVCHCLRPHKHRAGTLRNEILLLLGHTVCRLNRRDPVSGDYIEGQAFLQEVIDDIKRSREVAPDAIPNLRRQKGTLARALMRLAWTYESNPGERHRTRELFKEAHAEEPDNPYYLAEMIGFEINCTGHRDFLTTMSPVIRAALDVCRQHITDGTEMPFACFTSGRLRLLLDEGCEAVVDYAHGIRHLQSCASCIEGATLDEEKKWLQWACGAERTRGGYRWILDLIELADDRKKVSAGELRAGSPIEGPVLIAAGAAGTMAPDDKTTLTDMLGRALTGITGAVISGGTKVGIPEVVADALDLACGQIPGSPRPRLLGYLPDALPRDAPEDKRYEIVSSREEGFSPAQVISLWRDLLVSGIKPEDVMLFGFGGGRISAVEYAMALMMGATLYIVAGSKGSADALLESKALKDAENLNGLPYDAASVHALFQRISVPLSDDETARMAEAFHGSYRTENEERIPQPLRVWEKLNDTFRKANYEQARYTVHNLKSHGFEVVDADDLRKPVTAADYSTVEIDSMAETEHGRWIVERLKDGWRFGERDDKQKLHDAIVPWNKLPDSVRKWVRLAIREYPAILAKIGKKIVRNEHQIDAAEPNDE